MYFAYTEEQDEFRVSLRKFFDDYLPHAELPTLLEREGIGTTHWAKMAQQLGLQGLAIGEDQGGSGFGMIELTIVLEEAGRALVPEPLFSTLLGAASLGLASDGGQAANEILTDVASGDRILAAALTDDADDPVRAAVGPDGDWALSGTKVHVIAGQFAHTLVVLADTSDGTALFAVDPSVAHIEPVQSLDIARPQATVVLATTPAVLLSRSAGLGENVGLLGALLLAAEQVGGAARCLDIATEHAKSRSQFGRLIGSFQAVKHLCADMLVRHETARTALMYAAWAWDDGAEDRTLAVAVAKASASDAYWENSRACIQVLGGIGFTAEHPAQLHFKRASVSSQLFGSADAHRESITNLLIQSKVVPS
jgi:alkylation response protein AidB-like acyl-CoA dehydrogenase